MEITDFAKGSIWGIRAGAMEAMLRRIPSPESLAALSIQFKEDPEEDFDFMLRDGVAIIPVNGTIFKRGSIWSYLYGGTPLSVLNRVLSAALDDDDVEAILLDIDSPGGQVSGTDAFSDLVYSAREQKPVVAFANGTMASAAYWIGSAADRVIVERTAQVGSIGILYMHNDWSKYDADLGIKVTVISAGKYKAVGNNAEPLSDEARAIIQAELDQIYNLFIETVARNRGVDAGAVRSDMADGRVFIGQQAVDTGLADDTGTFNDALDAAVELIPEASGPSFYFSRRSGAVAPGKGFSMKNGQQEKVMPKTADQLAEVFPDLCAEIRKQGEDAADTAAIGKQAVTGEHDRILAIAKIHFGEEVAGKFEAVINTGVTAEQYQAIRPEPVKSEEEKAIEAAKAETLKAIQEAGADNPGAGGGGDDKDFMAVVEETAERKKISKTEAMKIVAKQNPELHQAFLKKANSRPQLVNG
ncbi:signal peptide peptidase SppA [uncultured Desulfosarcina sp.]|uniref:signal peptide peptidase SppA n=1 Tax=uncultured Desulfosarcina sp. TaxID=218289 RepID=UPI0029C98BEE|nr:signal peptide peptidase SppA [uncultured Desulfosarcina sp.]